MTKEIWEALEAIKEGYTGEVKDGCIIVENPDADAEGIALRGANPNLVIKAEDLMMLLDPR